MRAATLAFLAAVLTFVSAHCAIAANEKKSLVSPPLSINPNDGQPLCLVSNLSTTAASVTVEIVDASGTIAVSTPLVIPPGGVDGTTDRINLFYSYCRVTPQDSTSLSVLRASHCTASGNTSITCVEAK